MLSCQCPPKHILSPLALWEFKGTVLITGKPVCFFFPEFLVQNNMFCCPSAAEWEGVRGDGERWLLWCSFAIPFCVMLFVQLERQGRDAGLMWWKAVLLWGNKNCCPKGRLEQRWKIGVLFPKIERGHMPRAIIKSVLAAREVVCLVTHQSFLRYPLSKRKGPKIVP